MKPLCLCVFSREEAQSDYEETNEIKRLRPGGDDEGTSGRHL